MTLIHCPHTWRRGQRYKSKLLHPEPVLSTATPSYSEWFSMTISKTVLVFFQASCFLSKNSGGGPHKWVCMNFELQYLLSLFSNSHSWECSWVQSGHTAFTQGFALIKALSYHMNMQGIKYQERLLAKFIKICEWLCLGTFWQSSSNSPTH